MGHSILSDRQVEKLYNTAYDKAIDDAIEAFREFSKTHSIHNDPSFYFVHLTSMLQQLKKPTTNSKSIKKDTK